MPGFFKRLFGKRGVEAEVEPALPDFAAFPNPGQGTKLAIAYRRGDETWNEETDLVALLARVIGPCERDRDTLIAPNGLRFAPRLASFKPLDDRRGVKASTTIEVTHPTVFPAGVFEWQHSTGDTFEAAVIAGFERWAAIDLCALANAVAEGNLDVTCLQITLASGAVRRVVFSPVESMNLAPPDGDACGHWLGCPCCLFRRCIEVMQPLIDRGESFGIRLYAGRMADGAAVADCRVNGADFPAGAAALRRYVASWPGTELVAVKQYVVLQTPPITTN